MPPITTSLRRLLLLSSTTAANRRPFSALSSSPSPPPTTASSILYALKKLEHHPLKALSFLLHSTSHLSIHPPPSALSIILRSLARPDLIRHFRSLANKAEELSIPIDGGTYFTILVSLKKHNLNADAAVLTRLYERGRRCTNPKTKEAVEAVVGGEGIEERLDALGLHLDGSTVEEILQEVKNRPLAALTFFRWAEKRLGHEHASSTYNAMLRVLARAESMEEFWVLFEEMKGEGHEIDIDNYIKLMRIFMKGKLLEDAVKLYEFMMDSPYKPAQYECGLLLRQISLIDTPDLVLVNRVVNKYESNGYSLSKVEYDGILRSLTRSGEFDEAEKVLMKMKAAGFEPDNITYSQIVFGLCKARRLDDALKVIDDMESAGILPDVKTWTILIQGHFSGGKVDVALVCVKNMVEKNYELDGELLDVIMKGLCSHERVSDAHCLFIDMLKKAEVKPHQATFKYLIEKLLQGRKLEEALGLLGMMKKFQLPAYADPFSPYISKFGTVEDARNYLRTLNAKDYPSLAAYLYLLKSFFKEGRYSEAQDLLYKCPHHIRKHPDIAKLFGSIKPANAS